MKFFKIKKTHSFTSDGGSMVLLTPLRAETMPRRERKRADLIMEGMFRPTEVQVQQIVLSL